MNAVRKQRLLLVLLLIAGVGVAVALALFALRENINLYFSPTQMVQGEAPIGKKIRGGGLVVAGSIQRDPKSLEVTFKVTDGKHEVTVVYDGILPDLFVENSGVVVTGTLQEDGVFKATELLARHDENYMPPEVQKAIDKAHPGGAGSGDGYKSDQYKKEYKHNSVDKQGVDADKQDGKNE